MVQLDPLQIKIIAENAASIVLAKVKGDIRGVGQESEQTTKSVQGLSSGFRNLAGALGLVVGIRELAQFMKETATQAIQLETAVRSLRLQLGDLADVMITDLQRASKNTVSNLNLVAAANRALALGIAENDLPELMEVAAARARIMGITVTQAFNDIATGIGRQSRLILDNLGIILDLERANEEYAATLGKTVEQITEMEKKQAIVNDVLRASEEIVRLQAAAGEANVDALEQQRAEIDNLKAEIGEGLTPALLGLERAGLKAVTVLSNAIKGIRNIGVLTASDKRVLELRDAFLASGLTFEDFAKKAKGAVVSASGDIREFNQRLDDPAIRTYSNELSALRELLGENLIQGQNDFVVSQKLMNEVLSDGNITLEEARFLIEKNIVSVNDFNDAWLAVQSNLQGQPIRLNFDTSELQVAESAVDSIQNFIEELQGSAEQEGLRLDLFANILEQADRQGTSRIDVNEVLARRLGYGSVEELQNFLRENDIFTIDGIGEELQVTAATRRVEIAREDLDLRQEQLDIAAKIEDSLAQETIIREKLLENQQATKNLTDQTQESIEDLATIIETKVPGVNDLLGETATQIGRSATAADALADDLERALSAARSLAELND